MENSKIYTIPVTTDENGTRYIDKSIIDLILYVNSFGFDAKEVLDETNPSSFKARLNSIFKNSIAKGSNPWQNENAIIGEAPGFAIPFDKEKLDEHKEDIQKLLDIVGDISYFSDLSILRDEKKWTPLKQDIQKLLALANAAGFIDYQVTNTNMYDNNPELTIKR